LEKIKSEQERLVGYRKETAAISLNVAIGVWSVNPFYDQESSESMVKEFYPKMDFHRKNDVAKFLRVIANDLLFNATLPDDVKQYVDHKRKTAGITLKKVKI
jgi:hypothetical protein